MRDEKKVKTKIEQDKDCQIQIRTKIGMHGYTTMNEHPFIIPQQHLHGNQETRHRIVNHLG